MFYNQVVNDISKISDFIAYYEKELIQAKKEVSIYGSVEKNLAMLPGITEQRFNQLQEIDAVLNHLNMQLRKVQKKHFKIYLEGYARALTSKDAMIYANSEDECLEVEELVNEVSLLRNKYLGIMKGLESKNYMISSITRLKCAGLDDASV